MARVVFDLDGTLIDSAPDLHAIAGEVLAQEGAAPITLAEARDYIGNGAGVFVARMRAARGIGESEQERLLAAFVSRYEGAVSLTRPYPGVSEALERMQAQGHAMGICTNKPIRPTIAVLKHLGLDPFFGTVFGGDSLPVHKPDPAPLHAAFDGLGSGPCLYVGDSDVDAETGARAEVPFVLYTEGYRKSPVANLPHDAAFDDWSRLPDMVQGLAR